MHRKIRPQPVKQPPSTKTGAAPRAETKSSGAKVGAFEDPPANKKMTVPPEGVPLTGKLGEEKMTGAKNTQVQWDIVPKPDIDRRIAEIAAKRAVRQQQIETPTAVTYQGKQWDVDGMTTDGHVRLREADHEPRFVRLDHATGRALKIGKDEYRVMGGGHFGVKLEPGNLALDLDALSQHVNKGDVFFETDCGFWQASALHNHVLQISPLLDADVTSARLSELGGSIRVRLKGREDEGLFIVTTNEKGDLTANSNDANTPPFAITPDQVQARFVDDVSPDIGSHRVDSRKKAESLHSTGADASIIHPAHPEGASVIRDGQIHSVAKGTEVLVAQGDEVLGRLALEVSRMEGPIYSMMYDIDEKGPAGAVVQALIDKAPSTVRIGTNPSRPLAAELVSRFKAGGVQLYDGDLHENAPTIVHQKLITSAKRSVISSAPLIGYASAKIEALAVLSPHASVLLHEYAELTTRLGSNNPRRREVLNQLAAQGVVLNDPRSDLAYGSRAVNGLIKGADRRLDIWVDELKNAETTDDLIAQAQRGVKVTVRVREVDAESAKRVSDAKAVNPGLPLEIGVFERREGEPYPHLNVIVADDTQGYFGTMFLWKGQMSLLQPTGSSFESGVVLDGEPLTRLREGLREILPDARWQPV